MAFSELPSSAAWRHRDARDGFESVFVTTEGSTCRLDGHTAAVEDGDAWVVQYAITLDEDWLTRTARVWGWSRFGEQDAYLESDGSGGWRVNGARMPELDGCLDVDLESSACTNTMPVHRLRLEVGQRAVAPAAYVRALGLDVERLEQEYERVPDDGTHQRYDYRSPAFGFECHLVYDESGLVLDYPGIATRSL